MAFFHCKPLQTRIFLCHKEMNEQQKADLSSYMKQLLYLPKELRDFHDQKDIFKTIGNRKLDQIEIDWISGQVYTIDHFLWFMALHGYELKKTKSKKIERYDLSTTVEERKEEDRKIFDEYLQERNAH